MSNQNTLARVQGGGAIDQRRDPIGAMMQSLEPELRRALPAHVDGSRFVRLLMTQMRMSRDLAEAAMTNRASLMAALMQVSQLGLEPEPQLGHVYLIPRKRKGTPEVTVVIGYRGLLELARRSGRVRSAAARLVYEHDDIDINWGTEPSIRHKPKLRGKRGEIIGAYAIATLETAGGEETLSDWMTVDEINAIRDASPASRNGPWVEHYGEMVRKTIFRRLAKWLPLSPEVAGAALADGPDLADMGDFQVVDVEHGTVEDAKPSRLTESDSGGSADDHPDGARSELRQLLEEYSASHLNPLWRTMDLSGEPAHYLGERRDRLADVAVERGVSPEELRDMLEAV